jgi:plasmid stabilization system protein ParE
MPGVVIRPRARRDITEILIYYLDAAGADIASRFRKATAETFRELANSPAIGAPRKVRRPEFRGIRMWRVRGFESYLIFYYPQQDGIAVERVIHASQDYQRVLG